MLSFALLAFLLLAGADAPSPTATPVSSKPRSLADVVRENRARGEKKSGTFSIAGGGDVAPASENSLPAAVPGGRRPAARPAPAPGGGDEAYWRGRAQRLREEVESAQRTEAEEAARLREVLTKPRNSEEMLQFAEEIRRRQGVCRLRVESARRQLDALPEEARKAGANPGWLR
jgi:hypothetical protein